MLAAATVLKAAKESAASRDATEKQEVYRPDSSKRSKQGGRQQGIPWLAD